MPEDLLAIIIPVLNEAGSLKPRLEALQTLRQQGVKIILVDGGSADGSAEVAAPFIDTLLVAARGRAWQMNAGAQQATAEVLLFLHADTTLPVTAAAAIRHAIAAGALWGRFDVRLESPRRLLRLVERMMNWRSRLTGIATGDQAIFVRRAVFEQIGGYPPLALMEDIALSARLKRIASPACLRERVTSSARRWEKHGVLRTILLMWSLRLAYFFGADPRHLARLYGYTAGKKQTVKNEMGNSNGS
jgi:rSAM/selenodomain-associated transferase 2